MTLEKIKYPFLRYSKSASISRKYIVFSTGKSIIICNKDFDILHTVDNLDYAYHVFISPDESKLLVISNGNRFYLIDLMSFNVISTRTKAPYNANLEGRGCWMKDSRSFLIVCENVHTFRSAIRKYRIDDISKYEVVFPEKYWITSMIFVKEKNAYLIAAMDRIKAMTDQSDAWRLLWYDGTDFTEYPLSCWTDTIYNLDYDNQRNIIMVQGDEKYYSISEQGELISEDLPIEGEKSDTNGIGFPFTERVNVIKHIFDTGIVAIGTSNAFYAYDKEHNLIGKIREEYGVQEINAVSKSTILYATWSGIRVIKIN